MITNSQLGAAMTNEIPINGEKRGIWPEDRIEELRRMWGLGMSAGKIGQIMGISRGAVIGKVHRMDLPSRRTESRFPPWRPNRPLRLQRQPEDATLRMPRRKKPPINFKPFRPRVVAVVATPYDGPGKRFADIESHECRYPSGDGDPSSFRFCAKPVQIGLPYCLEHADLCYVRVNVSTIERGSPETAIPTVRAKEVADA